jgi:hypothetical protein
MAGEDYSVKTKVTADVSNFEKGMNKAEKSLKGFSNKLADNINRLGKKGLIGSIANVTLAMSGLTSSLSTVIKFAQQMGKAINECTEAYKGQVIAERALDTAIANNPFITGSSSKALKEFASEMQKVSNYGDEELIPMMTNLVSLGRTESETMQIMSVAMDMSAGMGISLDSAITQLNATLNGSIGRLGQQNAELKGLTEEELRQGKAIEILGEKFKGLSSATADTSKQLKNIRGDFKEAIGEFSLPSSEMWNKFWTGFYEKGIAVIKRFDDYLDTVIIGEKLTENIEAQLKKMKKGDNKTGYLREAYSVLSDRDLELVVKYLESQKKRNKNEELILQIAKEQIKSREFLNKVEKDYLEDLAEEERKRKQAQEEAEAREKALAELQKKQAEERAKQLKIENQWQDKILEQQISMLEAEKNSAVEGAEERGEATYEVERYYNEKILDLKLQQIENEREEALKGENVTADAKIAINQYYDNEVKKIYDDLGKYKAKKNKEEVKETRTALQETLKNVANIMQEVSKKMTDTFSKVVSKIKSIFSGVGGFLSKLFEFKPDEVLDNILKFEDSVLTFFVETLPKTPNFFSSVLESIGVLIKSISGAVKAEDVRAIVRGILKLFTDNLPRMVEDLVIIIEELTDGVIDALMDWLDSDEGLSKLLKLIVKIQKALEKLISKNLDKLADSLAKHTDDFADFLAESMTSANNTLPKLINAVLKIIGAIIQAVADAFKNQEFIDSIINAIIEMTNSIMDNLPRIIGSIVQLIVNIIVALAPRLPEIIMALVNGLADAIPKCIGQIVSGLAKGIGQIFKGLFERIFTWDFWKDALQTLGEVLTQIVADVFSGGLASLSGGAGSVTGNVAGDIGLGLATGGVSYLGHLFGWWAKGTNNAPAGLSIVGEAGPELVKFRGGEQVLNNRNTNKALAEMGGKTNNFNVTFNNLQDTTAFNMMQQLKAYNRQMAINGII